MNYTTTRLELLRKLYNEISEPENILLEAEMELNWELKEEYAMLEEVKQSLSQARFQPSSTSLRIIMDHAAQACMETTL